MSDLYRLEGCSVCGAVRVGLRTEVVMAREREGAERAVLIGGARVYLVDFCLSCRVAYEASLAPETP